MDEPYEMPDFDFGWIIGIIEGEGSIQSKWSGKYRQVQLQVNMTDEDVIRRFHAYVGGTVSGPFNPNWKSRNKTPEHYRPFWTWQMSAQKQTNDFLLAILPHLSQRRSNQALKALDTLDSLRDAALARKGI